MTKSSHNWHGIKRCTTGVKIPKGNRVMGNPCPYCGNTLGRTIGTSTQTIIPTANGLTSGEERPTEDSVTEHSYKKRSALPTVAVVVASLVIVTLAFGLIRGPTPDPMETWAKNSLITRREVARLLKSLADAEAQGNAELLPILCQDGSLSYPAWRATLESPPDDEVYRLTTNLLSGLASLLPKCQYGGFNTYGEVEHLHNATLMLVAAERRIAAVTNSSVAVAVTAPPPIGSRRPAENIKAWSMRFLPLTDGVIKYLLAAGEAADAYAFEDLQEICRNGFDSLTYSWRVNTLPAPDTELDRLTRITWDALERAFIACQSPGSSTSEVLVREFELVGNTMEKIGARLTVLNE